jgi:hypothetical protein
VETIVEQTQATGWFAPAAWAAILATLLSAGALLLLHFVSAEFAPSWRMVSEYTNGRHPAVLTMVFLAWALASFALIAALWPLHDTLLGTIGLALLLLAGAGQAMGGLFDINHKLHGPAAMIGIPALCAAAVVVTLAMARRSDITAPPLWSAHLPWIAFVTMIVALMLFFSGLKAAGVNMSGQAAPLTDLPAGVSGYVGWANRLLFTASYLWAVLASVAVLQSARVVPS